MSAVTDFAGLRAAARERCPTRTLVVAGATDEASILAAMGARAAGLADAILVGPESRVRSLVERLGADPTDFPVEDAEGDAEVAERAAALAAAGRANLLLKGQVPSAEVLRAVLSRRHGLRTDRLLSDLRLYEHPFAPDRFLGLTDGGVIPLPSLDERRAILENAVTVYHRLGFERPRVALLAASEKVTPTIGHTVEARALAELAAHGILGACAVDGPISLDLALSEESARRKGYTSEVAGRAEILVGPNIETINVLAKALALLTGSIPGQLVVGARIGVLIPSRSDGPEVKINSVALASLCM